MSLVTYNQREYLSRCLDSLAMQTYRDVEIVAADNSSTDGSVELLLDRLGSSNVLSLEDNRGYSHGHNAVMRSRDSDLVLCLNTDICLEPDYITHIVAAADHQPDAAAFGGLVFSVTKLEFLTRNPDFQDVQKIDTTGLFPRLVGVTYDRGQGAIVREEWLNRPHRVFGVSGCAAAYRRAALDDVAWQGEILDEDFHMYFEDVDLAWRLQLRGWSAAYVPSARAYHARTLPGSSPYAVHPGGMRRNVLRNRWLTALKVTPVLWLGLKIPFMVARDITLLPYWNQDDGAIPAAYRDIMRLYWRAMQKRHWAMSRRRTSLGDLLQWATPRAARGQHRCNLNGSLK